MPCSCPLCESENTSKIYYHPRFERDYFKCRNCDLVFADRSALLDSETEKSRYESHRNDIRDPGYENFLRRLIDPIQKLVSKESLGLDFGQGPYPMLLEIMEEDGYLMKGFDPLYNNDQEVLKIKYDYITCCEVAEHFNDPKADLIRMVDMLNPGGYLGISTGILKPETDLKSWYYKEDDTHINFFSLDCFNFLEKKFGLEIQYTAKDIVIFLKK